MHLAQFEKIFPQTVKEGFVNELNQERLQRAKAYLAKEEP